MPSPEVWSSSTPNLYKGHAIIRDEEGNNMDDFVFTTGLRTISQYGGTFHVNGRVEMLNDPLIFGHHYPTGTNCPMDV